MNEIFDSDCVLRVVYEVILIKLIYPGLSTVSQFLIEGKINGRIVFFISVDEL